MGREIEFKFRADNCDELYKVYEQLKMNSVCSDERQIVMHTRYLDTPDRVFKRNKWMLRIREENDNQVLTMKTSESNHVRGEWNVQRLTTSEYPMESELLALVHLGAPLELNSVNEFFNVCEAKFIRTCVMLSYLDGTRIELAADHGVLCGENEVQKFQELELELYEGSVDRLIELAESIELPEEPLSKIERALRLG